ncbi:hypothetical protein KY290_018631 [Solanum tuberosum]|uniref:Uncharacterized protein n=1 Tax=Solanum tuberosum TaxID=4113 RepID=A0ABQ7VET1_SOLTU|nr:hypothetical protein KY289_017753 [Solanum tuberosum]KAH0762558.1 hypothetical protein KY290_018631 [Solanum tuberosum]
MEHEKKDEESKSNRLDSKVSKAEKKRFASTVKRQNIPSMASKAITTRFTESFRTFTGILSIAATLAKMFFQANLTWKITRLVIMVTINVLIRHWAKCREQERMHST